jgi:hypothetical protein
MYQKNGNFSWNLEVADKTAGLIKNQEHFYV